MKRLSNEDFIEKINLIHPGKYEYPEEYINSRQKMRIICPTHGSFFQLVSDHLGGHGCKECAHNRPLDKETFIKTSGYNLVHIWEDDFNTLLSIK